MSKERSKLANIKPKEAIRALERAGFLTSGSCLVIPSIVIRKGSMVAVRELDSYSQMRCGIVTIENSD